MNVISKLRSEKKFCDSYESKIDQYLKKSVEDSLDDENVLESDKEPNRASPNDNMQFSLLISSILCIFFLKIY